MKFVILCDANWEARLDSVTKYFSWSGYRDIFESRDYGEGLCGVSIVLMCRDPHLKFKQRIRIDKKEKNLYMDVMLDIDQMREAQDDQRRKIVVEKLSKEIPFILQKYSIPDFDRTRFIEDLHGWLKKME